MPGPQNKNVTFTGSTAVVHSFQCSRNPANPAGPITAEVWGRVNLSDGTTEEINAPPIVLSGALETLIRGLMDAQALTRLRSANGLEAP